MATNLPVQFRKSAEGAIASYDYTDISEGTGVSTFYGCGSIASGADTYPIQASGALTTFLTQSIVYSSLAYIRHDFNSTAGLKLDRDFDLTQFNAPKRIGGKCGVNIVWGVETGSTTAAFIILKLRKWDGTTETDIGSFTSEPNLMASAAICYFNFDVTPTNFKRGDILRLTVEGWGMGGGSGGTIILGIDPKDRTDVVNCPVSSQLKVNVPFKLDV